MHMSSRPEISSIVAAYAVECCLKAHILRKTQAELCLWQQSKNMSRGGQSTMHVLGMADQLRHLSRDERSRPLPRRSL